MKYRQTMNRWFAPAAVTKFSPELQRLARRDRGRGVRRRRHGLPEDLRRPLPGSRLPPVHGPARRTTPSSSSTACASCPAAPTARPTRARSWWDGTASPSTGRTRSTAAGKSPLDPDVDFVTHIARATMDGEPLPDVDILDIMVTLTLGSLDTLKSQLGWCMYHLATHPEDRRRIVADPSLIPGAVEEFLRAYPDREHGPEAHPGLRLPRVPDEEGRDGAAQHPVGDAATHACSRSPRRSSSTARRTGTSPSEPASTAASAPTSPVPSCVYALEEWHAAIPEYEVCIRRAADGSRRPGLPAHAALGLDRVKPAPFEYHAPDHRRRGGRRCSPSTATTPRCSPAARAWCRCWRCAWPASTTSSTSAASPSSSGVERQRTARCVVGATTRDAVDRARRRGGARRCRCSALRHAADRPLPDPQPRHGRRLARPRRSRRPSTRRSRSALDAEFEVALGARRAPRSPPPTSSSASGRRRWSPTSCSSAIRFPVWDGRAASASTSSPAATATSPSPARSPASSSAATARVERCAIALFGLGLDAGAGAARPRRPLVGAAGRRRRARRDRAARRRRRSTTRRRRPRAAALPHAGRRRDGREGTGRQALEEAARG